MHFIRQQELAQAVWAEEVQVLQFQLWRQCLEVNTPLLLLLPLLPALAFACKTSQAR